MENIMGWPVWFVAGIVLILLDLKFATAYVLAIIGISCLVGAAIAAFTPLGLGFQSGVVILLMGLLLVPVIYRASFKETAGQQGAREQNFSALIRFANAIDQTLQKFLFHFVVFATLVLILGAIVSEDAPAAEHLGAISTAGSIFGGLIGKRYTSNGLYIVLCGVAGLFATGLITAILIGIGRAVLHG